MPFNFAGFASAQEMGTQINTDIDERKLDVQLKKQKFAEHQMAMSAELDNAKKRQKYESDMSNFLKDQDESDNNKKMADGESPNTVAQKIDTSFVNQYKKMAKIAFDDGQTAAGIALLDKSQEAMEKADSHAKSALDIKDKQTKETGSLSNAFAEGKISEKDYRDGYVDIYGLQAASKLPTNPEKLKSFAQAKQLESQSVSEHLADVRELAAANDKRRQTAIQNKNEQERIGIDKQRLAQSRELNLVDIKLKNMEIKEKESKLSQDSTGSKGLSGNDYLKTLSEKDQGIVKAIAENRMQPADVGRSGAEREKIMEKVAQYDPNYDSSAYKTKSSVEKDFAAGATSKIITSINTSIGHLGTFDELANALGNSDTKAVNRIINKFSDEIGKPEVNNLNMAKGAIANELMSTFRKAGSSDAEAARWEKEFQDANSPEQMKGAVKTAARLLHSRIDSIDNSWKRGMKTDKSYPGLIDPEAQKVLDKFTPSKKNSEELSDDELAHMYLTK